MLLPDKGRAGISRLPRFVRTVTFKLALVQAGLFAASAAVLFVAVYWSLAGYARTQLRASISVELATRAEERNSDGADELTATIAARTRDRGSRSFAYLLQAADGSRLAGALEAGSLHPGWQDLPASAVKVTPGQEPYAMEALAQRLPTGELLAVALTVSDETHVKKQVVRSFGLGAIVTLALAMASGVLTSLAALRRVEAINATTRGIMEGDLGRRLPERGTGDEFDRLAANTNTMLDRIQLLMEGLRQVSNDIAHDLRTPLTHLRQRLENTRGGPRTLENYESSIDAASGDVDTILRIFASLLRIAQIEAGSRRAGFSELDVSEVFVAIAEAYGPVAEDAGQTLQSDIEPHVHLRGDRDLLTQMLANLVENAIHHAGAGARVAIELHRDGLKFVGAVTDSGAGIPVGERDRVFGRFVRLDASRLGEGHGLGLAMVKAVADLHSIDLVLSDARPGLRVTMRGPTSLAPDAAGRASPSRIQEREHIS